MLPISDEPHTLVLNFLFQCLKIRIGKRDGHGVLLGIFRQEDRVLSSYLGYWKFNLFNSKMAKAKVEYPSKSMGLW